MEVFLKYKYIRNIKLIYFKKYIEILLLILISFSPLISQEIKGFLVLILILTNVKYLKSFDTHRGLILFLFLSYFLFSIVLDLRNVSSILNLNILNFFFPLTLILGFIVSKKYNITDFLGYLENIIFILAFFSLIGVFIYTFLPDLVNKLPSYNFYHTTHKTGYFFNILIQGSSIVKRNAGIAWEPGAFQFLLNIGFYSYLKINKKNSLFRISIYSISIFTTRSTVGIFILFILIIKYVTKNKNTIFMFIIVLLLLYNTFYEELVYQINYKLIGSYAFEIRIKPFLDALIVGKNNFFGLGNTGFDLFYNDIQAPWESIGQIITRYGYILIIYIFLRLFNLLKNYKILFIILILTFFSQNIWYFPLITPFYFPFKDK